MGSYKKVIRLNPSTSGSSQLSQGSVCEELNPAEISIAGHFRKGTRDYTSHHKVLFNMGVVFAKMGYELKARMLLGPSREIYNRYPYSFLNLSLYTGRKRTGLERFIIWSSAESRCNPGTPFCTITVHVSWQWREI